MELKTEKQIALIIGSFKRVFKNNDITKLTKQAYGYLNLACGFIAHYNLYGFQAYYEDVEKLKRDILLNKRMNQWDNFWPGERDYEYMMQKKLIYNKICELIS